MTFDHISLFSQKFKLPTCDSFISDGSHFINLLIIIKKTIIAIVNVIH